MASAIATSMQLLLVVNLIFCSRMNDDLTWWQKGLIYRIVPQSFQDSDNDGFGDIKGIISRISHLEYLSVKVVCLAPIFPWSAAQYGQSATTFTNVHPELGTLKDMATLAEELHKRGIKLVLEVPLHHTSSQHEWFRTSKQYEELYIWRPGIPSTDSGERPKPPNNWKSHFGSPAWTWDETREQYYLHSLTPEQPQLNLDSFFLQQKIWESLYFWLEREVDGFLIEGFHHVWPTQNDSEVEGTCSAQSDDCHANYVQGIPRPDYSALIKHLRSQSDIYAANTNFSPFLMINATEISSEEGLRLYEAGANLVIGADLGQIDSRCGGQCVHDLIQTWHEKLPENAWPVFVLGSPDVSRVGTRKGLGFVNALNVLLMTLPGTPITYQGEELGLQDVPVDFDTYDSWGRDVHNALYHQLSSYAFQTPMLWEEEKHAGFSYARKTWLPVHAKYKQRNVEIVSDTVTQFTQVKNDMANIFSWLMQKQQFDDSGRSNLQIFHEAVKLRRHPSFQNSQIQFAVINKNLISYIRHSGDHYPGFLVALNLGASTSVVDYRAATENFYHKGEVWLNTGQIKAENLQVGQIVSLEDVRLRPGEGVVIRMDVL